MPQTTAHAGGEVQATCKIKLRCPPEGEFIRGWILGTPGSGSAPMGSGYKFGRAVMEIKDAIDGNNAMRRAFERRDSISIEGTGRINFTYTGPLRREGEGGWFFESTNEEYPRKFLDALEGIRGITNYLGIIGGIDQHPQILGALKAHNRIKNIMLIDRNPIQVLAAAMAFSTYNKVASDMQARHSGIGVGKWRDFLREDFRLEGVSIKLEAKELVTAIADAKRGRYFIYLSNAISLGHWGDRFGLTGWMNMRDSNRVLRSIRDNPRIEVGSTVLVTDAGTDDHVALRKIDEGFELYAFARQPPEQGRLALIMGILKGMRAHSEAIDAVRG